MEEMYFWRMESRSESRVVEVVDLNACWISGE